MDEEKEIKVFVYFNLHRKCFSVKALNGIDKGRVIQHADNITLYDIVCKVSEKGRERVLREQRKNVHAGIVGYIRKDSYDKYSYLENDNIRRITYNPYKYKSFVFKNDSQPVVGTFEKAILEVTNKVPSIFVIDNDS